MSVTKLLALANPIFKEIDEHIYSGNIQEAYELLNSPQPIEWIKEDTGVGGNTFYYNDIVLLEALMTRIFTVWRREIISNTINQEKGRFASTSIARIHFKEFGKQSFSFTDGIATEYAHTLEALRLATPLSATNGKRNAIKQLGSLFGLSLNRIDGEERMPETMPIITHDNVNTDDEEKKKYLDFKALLESAETKQVAEIMLSGSEFKLIRELQLIVQNKK